MEIIVLGLELTRKLALKAGPYLIVEMLLPGGTLLALVLYLYRRRAPRDEAARPTPVPSEPVLSVSKGRSD
jgi:hypothetical protein